MTTINKFHWFWAWDDEKEEAWLREMSLDGWHLKSYHFPSNYEFEKGQSVDYVYRLDYFVDRKDFDNYLQLFHDAGWDHLGDMGGWQYFRKETIHGEAQEIYSDNESKKKKYQRILLFLVIFLPIYANLLIITNRSSNIFIQIITFILFLIMLMYGYAILRLIRRISELKQKI